MRQCCSAPGIRDPELSADWPTIPMYRRSALCNEFGTVLTADGNVYLGDVPREAVIEGFSGGALLLRGFRADVAAFRELVEKLIDAPVRHPNYQRQAAHEDRTVLLVDPDETPIPAHSELAYSPLCPELIFFHFPPSSLVGYFSRRSPCACSRTAAPFAQWAPRLNGLSKPGSWPTQTPWSTSARTVQPTEQCVHTDFTVCTVPLTAPCAFAVRVTRPTVPSVSRAVRATPARAIMTLISMFVHRGSM